MSDINKTAIYTSADVAKLFGLAERHVWRYLKEGTLAGRKVGKHWFVTGKDILHFVSRGNMTAKPQSKRVVIDNPPKQPVTQHAVKSQVSHAQPTQTREAREAAVSKAWTETGGNRQLAAQLLNEWVKDGSGPPPQRSNEWTPASVDGMLKRIKKQQNQT